MRGLRDMLMQEQKHLIEIIRKVGDAASTPEGNLRISKDKGRARYYHCIDDRYGTYISKKDQILVEQLAQKSYNSAIVNKAQTRLKQIEDILEDYSDDEIEQVYKSLNDERKTLVKPVEPIYEQQMEKWYNQSYLGKEFQEGTPVIVSEKGERVRSKSEKIIADWLFRNEISYLYEKPLKIMGYGVLYPDFTFLSKKTGKEIYWEHEGMMDNPEYAKNAIKKIELYEKNGIFPGENLILTFETSLSVISTELIRKYAEKYLIVS